jgi:glycosyltransferase involved in cell wall biosynthesis
MNKQPLAVLHVLGSLEPGGVETWLLDLLNHLDSRRWRFDFCTLGMHTGRYTSRVQSRGARVIPCPFQSRKSVFSLARFAAGLHGVLRRGAYDIVHSHVHHFSAVVLAVAEAAGTPVRIAHSHNTQDGAEDCWLRNLYRAGAIRLLAKTATVRLACSADAGKAFFADPNSPPNSGVKILRYGLSGHWDSGEGPRAAGACLRRELGIGSGEKVVGMVGRFDRQKNHQFLLKVAAEMRRRDPRIRWLLVGGGPLLPLIEEEARRMGVQDCLRFCGVREDVRHLMFEVMDALILPSLHEGLPLALLEAQAAGLRALVSSRVTPEAAVVDGAVELLPLEAGPAAWAGRVQACLELPKIPRASAWQQIAAAGFTLEQSLQGLLHIYRSALSEAAAQNVRPACSRSQMMASRNR